MHEDENYWSDKDDRPYITTDGDIIRYCLYVIAALVILIFILIWSMP